MHVRVYFIRGGTRIRKEGELILPEGQKKFLAKAIWNYP
jgi:hypothetical protein